MEAWLASANGRALLLQQQMEAKIIEAQENLRQVVAAGASALSTTIDGFRIELGKHEYANNLARRQIDAVVSDAERKLRHRELRLSGTLRGIRGGV